MRLPQRLFKNKEEEKEPNLIKSLKEKVNNSLIYREKTILDYTLRCITRAAEKGDKFCVIEKNHPVIESQLFYTTSFLLSENNLNILKAQGIIVDFADDETSVVYHFSGW